MNLLPLVPGDASNWPYIGYIKSYFPCPEIPGGHSVGTGTLVAPRLVLTAGHVLFDPAQGGKTTQVDITFGGPQGTRVVSTAVDFPTQWRDVDSRLGTSVVAATDVGVVILPNAIDSEVRPIGFNTASDRMLAGMTLSVAGYPAEPPQVRGTLYGARFGLVQGGALPPSAAALQDFRLFYPVLTVPGVSGGPVYDLDAESGVRTVRGIHTSFPPGIGLGSALRITETVFQYIQFWVGQCRP